MRIEYVREDEYVILEVPVGYQPPDTIVLWNYDDGEKRIFVNRVWVKDKS